MEQSQFIFEVQSRQCIWNPFVASYLDRFQKRQAWEEIAAKMYGEFHSCSDNEKKEKVRELQKKWKSLKDYYKRRNPKEDRDENTKQKKPIVVLLQFLDKVTKYDQSKRKQQRITKQIKKIKNKNLIFQLPDYKITVQKFNDEKPISNDIKTINFRPTNQTSENESRQNEMNFLQSLLPVMQSLSDRQRFDFKLEVMMLIKKIKYEEEDSRSRTEVLLQNNVCSFNRPALIEKTPRLLHH